MIPVIYSSVIGRVDDEVEVESSGLVESVEHVAVKIANRGDPLHGGVPGGVLGEQARVEGTLGGRGNLSGGCGRGFSFLETVGVTEGPDVASGVVHGCVQEGVVGDGSLEAN